MKPYRLILWLFIVALSANFLCAESTPITDEIVKANNSFALDLYAHLARQPGNLVFSPFSIDATLAMTYAGARGETAQQMAKALHLPSDDANIHAGFASLLNELNEVNVSGCQLDVVNSLWAQLGYSFSESFQNLLHDQYHSRLNQIDLTGWPHGFDSNKALAARRQINKWVANETSNKIKEILPQNLPTPNTRLVLVNAIYFKGLWTTSFDKSLTRNAAFYVSSGKSILVPTMHTEASFEYSEDENVQVLEMPYFSNQLSMIILLPKTNYGLSKLEENLTVSQIEQFEEASHLQKVNVSLPKFKQTSEFDLIRPLTAMGIKNAFDENDADFSGITSMKPFFVEAVIHKTYVDVDEEGSEAAAATGVVFADSLSVTFNANHPFLFLIRDNPSGAILFIGRIINPLNK